MQTPFLIPLLFVASCSWFQKTENVITVGAVTFSKEYYSKRFIEKLKNLDGLHIKDVSVTQSFSSALTQELIVEGYLYNWAAKNNIHFSKNDIFTYLRDHLASSAGVENDFLFEAQPSKNLLEDSVKIQLIRDRLMKRLGEGLVVSPEDVSDYLKAHSADINEKKVHLAQIFLEKEADAEMILKFLRASTPFEALAKKYSLSPEGQKGGDMGWVSASGNKFLEPVFNAPVGVLLKIFKSPQGYHLYKIIEFQKSANQPLDNAKKRATDAIREKRIAEAYLLWLQEQVKTVRVETNEGVIQSLNPSYQETL